MSCSLPALFRCWPEPQPLSSPNGREPQPRWAPGGPLLVACWDWFRRWASCSGVRRRLCSLPWDASHGAFCVGVDALGAFFLLPVLGLSALAAVYGGDYLLAYRHEKSLGIPWFFFNVFVAGMVLVVVARTALLFLVAWEVMSVAAYFLVTFEQEKAGVRKAGWVYPDRDPSWRGVPLFRLRAAGPKCRKSGVRSIPPHA